jgi:hypothetical protein
MRFPISPELLMNWRSLQMSHNVESCIPCDREAGCGEGAGTPHVKKSDPYMRWLVREA